MASSSPSELLPFGALLAGPSAVVAAARSLQHAACSAQLPCMCGTVLELQRTTPLEGRCSRLQTRLCRPIHARSALHTKKTPESRVEIVSASQRNKGESLSWRVVFSLVCVVCSSRSSSSSLRPTKLKASIEITMESDIDARERREKKKPLANGLRKRSNFPYPGRSDSGRVKQDGCLEARRRWKLVVGSAQQ